MNTEVLWNNFLSKIKERISSLSYDTWFKDTKLFSLNGDILVRKFFAKGDKISLRADNKSIADISVKKDDDFYIIGKIIV